VRLLLEADAVHRQQADQSRRRRRSWHPPALCPASATPNSGSAAAPVGALAKPSRYLPQHSPRAASPVPTAPDKSPGVGIRIWFNESHLVRLLREFAAYYNRDRPHRSLDLHPPRPRSLGSTGPIVSRPTSSTRPGGGVHGRCGFHAARAALHDVVS
jgi:hypothetical protein